MKENQMQHLKAANDYRAIRKACWAMFATAAGKPDLHEAAAILGAQCITKRVAA